MVEDSENSPNRLSRRAFLTFAAGAVTGEAAKKVVGSLTESVDEVQVELAPEEQAELREIMHQEVENGIQGTIRLLNKAWESEDSGSVKVNYYAALARSKQTWMYASVMNEIVPVNEEERLSVEDLKHRQLIDRGIMGYFGVLHEVEQADLPVPQALRPPESLMEQVSRFGKQALEELLDTKK